MALIFVIVKKVINHHVTKWAWLNYNHSAVLRWRSSTVSQGWWPCCFYSPARPPSVGQTIAIRASLAATEASLIYPRCLTTRKRPHPDRSNTVNITTGIAKPYDLLLDQERIGRRTVVYARLYIVSTTCCMMKMLRLINHQLRTPAQHTGSRSRMIHVGTPTGSTPAEDTANVQTRLNLRAQTLPWASYYTSHDTVIDLQHFFSSCLSM